MTRGWPARRPIRRDPYRLVVDAPHAERSSGNVAGGSSSTNDAATTPAAAPRRAARRDARPTLPASATAPAAISSPPSSTTPRDAAVFEPDARATAAPLRISAPRSRPPRQRRGSARGDRARHRIEPSARARPRHPGVKRRERGARRLRAARFRRAQHARARAAPATAHGSRSPATRHSATTTAARSAR